MVWGDVVGCGVCACCMVVCMKLHQHTLQYTHMTTIHTHDNHTHNNTHRGHTGKVRCVLWSEDDTRIYTTGVDGAVYEWKPRKQTYVCCMYAVCAHVYCMYTRMLYVHNTRGHGGPAPYVHPIHTHSSHTHTRRGRDYVTKGVVYTAIAARHDGSSVFVAGSDGSLRV